MLTSCIPGLAFIEKQRTLDINNPVSMTVIGDVKDRDVILVDDEVNTGGSMVHAVEILKEHHARNIYMVFIHPVLSEDAPSGLADLPVEQFITTNTIFISPEKKAILVIAWSCSPSAICWLRSSCAPIRAAAWAPCSMNEKITKSINQ
jgi:phosphoribosylpyrophosphate synthetase